MITDVAWFSASRLTAILRDALNVSPLVVSGVKAAQLSFKTAYNAQLFRLTLTYDQATPAAPATLIAKLPPDRAEMAENCAVFQPGTKEAWFYRAIAPTGCITAPQCYFALAERATGLAALLLTDLGELETTSQTAGMSIADATLALQEAARLHACWWNQENSAALAELRDLNNNGADSTALVDQFYAEAWPHFLQNAQFAISATVNAFGATLVGRGAVIEALCDNSPKTLLHGDFRVDNMLFAGRSAQRQCYVLDWEDVSVGCCATDVTWLIAGCVPAIDADQEQQLLKSYHTALCTNGVTTYTYEQCLWDYRRAMVERFVQGILSGTIADPALATIDERAFARAMGERFVAAAERLALQELL